LVVGDAEVEDDLLDALAALERELDLDRRRGVAAEDGVGEVVAVARARAGLLGEGAFAFPAAEPELLLQQQAKFVNPSMWRTRPWFGCQVRKRPPAIAVPRLVSQTNGGSSTERRAERAQPAATQRSRRPRAVR
jgi:hypothetical protein